MPVRARREICVLVLAAALATGADAPAGEIAGVLKFPERARSVAALDRETKKSYPAELDAKTGEYRVRNLPAGTYDLVLETAAGRVEGVDLKPPESLPRPEPTTLKPSEADREGVAGILSRLGDILSRGGPKMSRPDGFVVRVREGRFSSAGLKGRTDAEPGGDAKLRDVPLTDDEREETNDSVLALPALARVRDTLPRDYDLAADVAEGGACALRITPVAPELTDKDRAWIVDWVAHLNLFENKKRVLDMDGTGERARVLVERLRDDEAGPTTLDVLEPTAFWRIEIWEFNKHYGGWTKDKAVVVVREQVPIRVFRTYRRMFEKRLGGIRVPADGAASVAPFEVPEKPDAARGRVP